MAKVVGYTCDWCDTVKGGKTPNSLPTPKPLSHMVVVGTTNEAGVVDLNYDSFKTFCQPFCVQAYFKAGHL